MEKEPYIAHTSEDGRPPQLLREHLVNVGQLAAGFAQPLGLEAEARVAGENHDDGKYSWEFQQYIRGKRHGRVDHSTAGAKVLWGNQTLRSAMEALCVAGHHAGLPDYGTVLDTSDDITFRGRMKRETNDISAFRSEMNSPVVDKRPFFYDGADWITNALEVRMLFSCLVDADFLDTEAYMSDGQVARGGFQSMEVLHQKFFEGLKEKGFFHPTNTLNEKRAEILKRCIAEREEEPGLFSLTVPTGGGKTISAFAFALAHAKKYHKKRIIYVIPYTSIIEQTADVLRSFLGNDSVIEHHSQVEYDDTSELMTRQRLATENWDAPVIVTTNVQFFESLFANRTSRCRKLHNIADSVILFDEAQMFPVRFMKPVVKSIESLTRYFHCTAVLMSATQPRWQDWFDTEKAPVREIMTDIPALYKFFRRTQLVQDGEKSYEDVAEALQKSSQSLCIALTKSEAASIYECMPEGTFYLSTNLCPVHREAVIREMKRRLRAGEPCHVVSTNIISVGVDIDFPVVYIEECGLDAIIQGAGRCNRERKRPAAESLVHIFQTEKSRETRFMRQERQCSEATFRQVEDLSGTEAVKLYFRYLYEAKDSILDANKILPLTQTFSFAEIGRLFHLIENNTKSLFIPLNEEAQDIARQLRMGIRTRELMRKAGRYMVSVRSNVSAQNHGEFENLIADGYAELLDPELAILTNMSIYDEVRGLVYNKEEGKGLMI